jgi:hypothetical protein
MTKPRKKKPRKSRPRMASKAGIILAGAGGTGACRGRSPQKLHVRRILQFISNVQKEERQNG